MNLISYTDRRGKDCKMWTRVTNMYSDDDIPGIDILSMREDEFVPHGYHEDKKIQLKRRADRQILD